MLSRRKSCDRILCLSEINHQPGTNYDISSRLIDKLRFYPEGLFGKDGAQNFYEPKNPSHVSHSISNLQETQNYFRAECKTVAAIMRQLHHSRCDLLKMDIEGAEISVLENLLETKIYPSILRVEFDSARVNPVAKIEAVRTKRLAGFGYRCIAQQKYNMTYFRRPSL